MIKNDSSGSFAIFLSFVAALFLSILPLPDGINLFKPDWVALVLIYWVMAMPNRIGVLVGWSVGIVADVLYGTLFGIHAMSLALVAYLIQLLYHRLRLFPRWKQSINIGVVIGIHMLLGLILRKFIQPISFDFSYWFPVFTSLILWPWVFIILRDVRRNFCKEG
ncbi:MAG: rod shape-determining protein MreD [Gammaproteobacteria bacterium]|nr:MAG: rod shape-determining protein MreD [Gammaproteobacteria bacterium]